MHGNTTGGAEIMADKCPTITASAGMSGNNQPVIVLETFHIRFSDKVTEPLKAIDYKDPLVVLDRAAYNQGENAKYDFEAKVGGVSPPVIARGPGAVCYRSIVPR